LTNDEIIFETTDYQQKCKELEALKLSNCKIEAFNLFTLPHHKMFIKQFLMKNGTAVDELSIKCVNPIYMNQVVSYMTQESITEEDLRFIHEGYPVKFEKSIFE